LEDQLLYAQKVTSLEKSEPYKQITAPSPPSEDVPSDLEDAAESKSTTNIEAIEIMTEHSKDAVITKDLEFIQESKLASLISQAPSSFKIKTDGNLEMSIQNIVNHLSEEESKLSILAKLIQDKLVVSSSRNLSINAIIKLELQTLKEILGEVNFGFLSTFERTCRHLLEWISILTTRCQRYVKSNAELLSRVQTFRGNIMAYLRVRPGDLSASKKTAFDFLSDTEVAFYDKRSSVWRPFAFDTVFSPSSSQFDIFNEVEPLVASVVSGITNFMYIYI
jgi:hypothetical protein